MMTTAETSPPVSRPTTSSPSPGNTTKIQGSATPDATSTRCSTRRWMGRRSRRAYLVPDCDPTPSGMNTTTISCTASTTLITSAATSDAGALLANASPARNPPTLRANTEPSENTIMATGASTARMREICSTVSRRDEPRTPLSNSRHRRKANARSWCIIPRASPGPASSPVQRRPVRERSPRGFCPRPRPCAAGASAPAPPTCRVG